VTGPASAWPGESATRAPAKSSRRTAEDSEAGTQPPEAAECDGAAASGSEIAECDGAAASGSEAAECDGAAASGSEAAECDGTDDIIEMLIDGVARGGSEAAECDCADPVEGGGQSLGRRALSTAVEWLVVLVCSLGLALLLKSLLVEVFEIPSGSMEPTLMIDNRVVVYKLGYRLHGVNRGDVIVFDSPGRSPDGDNLIKRVVALEGETFELRDGSVYIDGARIDEPYLADEESTFPKSPIPGCVNDADSQRCEVPEGKLIVLGDSRENSRDSRFFGPVDTDDIVGRAFIKIWPPSDIGSV